MLLLITYFVNDILKLVLIIYKLHNTLYSVIIYIISFMLLARQIGNY